MLLTNRQTPLRRRTLRMQHMHPQPRVTIMQQSTLQHVRRHTLHRMHKQLRMRRVSHIPPHRMRRRRLQTQTTPQITMPAIHNPIPELLHRLIIHRMRRISPQTNHLILGHQLTHTRVNLLTRRNPTLTTSTRRTLPQTQGKHGAISHTATNKRRRIIRLTAIKEQAQLVSRIQSRQLRITTRIPLLPAKPTILRRNSLVIPLTTRLRRRRRRIHNILNNPIRRQPRRITTNRTNNLRRSLNRQRRIRRSLQAVVHQTEIRMPPILSRLPTLTSLQPNRLNTLTSSVTQMQNTRLPRHRRLRRVTTHNTHHRQTAVRRGPVLRLITHRQRRTRPLSSLRIRRNSRNKPRLTISTTDTNITNPDVQPLTILRRTHRLQSAHRVTRLLLRHSQQTNPRIRLNHTNNPATNHTRHRRPQQGNQRHNSSQRILTPTLTPLQHNRRIQEHPVLIRSVIPQKKTQLLIRKSPRPTTRANQILRRPRHRIPTNSMLRQQPTTRRRLRPRRPHRRRRKRPTLTRHNRRTTQTVTIPGLNLLPLLSLNSLNRRRRGRPSLTRPCHETQPNAYEQPSQPYYDAAQPEQPPPHPTQEYSKTSKYSSTPTCADAPHQKSDSAEADHANPQSTHPTCQPHTATGQPTPTARTHPAKYATHPYATPNAPPHDAKTPPHSRQPSPPQQAAPEYDQKARQPQQNLQ